MSNTTTIVFVKTSNQYIVTLPKALIQALKWEAGDKLQFTVASKNNRVIVNVERTEGNQEMKE